MPSFLRWRLLSFLALSLQVVAQGATQPKQQAQPTRRQSARQSTSPSGTQARHADQAQLSPLANLNPDLLSSLHWRSIGPYR
ncbi:MAG TPA: hypothetical protein VGK21_17685, partial [Candidatus Angelobacter sp.]